MKAIEDYALKAPKSVKTSPEALAAYLVKPCNTDMEKLRSIYWWVTHNIEYDVRLMNEGKRHGNTPGDVLATGAAVCAGYSGLCGAMLRSVGVEVEEVSGVSKGAGYHPGMFSQADNTDDGAHAWNKVKIDGTWFLMDATWSAGACSSDTGKHKFEFAWDENYFLAEPESFLSEHLPLETNLNTRNIDASNVLSDPQLVAEPFTDVASWDMTPHMKPACWNLGIKPVNYQDAVIRTSNNTVRIKLSTKIPIDSWVFLKQITDRFIITHAEQTWISNNGKEIEVCVRLPEDGTYNLQICGHPWRMQKLPDGHNKIWVSIEYRIVAKGITKGERFPSGTKRLGPSLQALDAGFRVLEPTDYVIIAKNGKARVVLEMPHDKNLVKFWASLLKSNTKLSDRNLLVERNGKMCIIHAVFPEPAEYLLDVHLPSKSNFGYSGVSFLIDCKKTKSMMPTFPSGCHRLMGPTEIFIEKGMSIIYPNSSTIYTKEGRASIITRYDHPVKTFIALQDHSGNRYDSDVDESPQGDLVQYEIKLKQPGIYQFGIYIRKDGNQGDAGAIFLIVVPEESEE